MEVTTFSSVKLLGLEFGGGFWCLGSHITLVLKSTFKKTQQNNNQSTLVLRWKYSKCVLHQYKPKHKSQNFLDLNFASLRPALFDPIALILPGRAALHTEHRPLPRGSTVASTCDFLASVPWTILTQLKCPAANWAVGPRLCYQTGREN